MGANELEINIPIHTIIVSSDWLSAYLAQSKEFLLNGESVIEASLILSFSRLSNGELIELKLA